MNFESNLLGKHFLPQNSVDGLDLLLIFVLFFFLKKGPGEEKHLEISPLLDEFLHFPESKKTIVSCNWTVWLEAGGAELRKLEPQSQFWLQAHFLSFQTPAAQHGNWLHKSRL